MERLAAGLLAGVKRLVAELRAWNGLKAVEPVVELLVAGPVVLRR
ncbi:MAG: hypothetical protein R2855_09840 [Thermomicrobiales bacterium]